MSKPSTPPLSKPSTPPLSKPSTPPLSILPSASTSSSYSTPTSIPIDPEIERLFPNCTPPKITADRCREVANGFGIDWTSLPEPQRKVLSFLFDREVHKYFESTGLHILDPQTVVWDLPRIKMDVGRRLVVGADPNTEEGRRAAAIVSERGQTFLSNAPSGTQHYNEFVLSMGGRAPWEISGSEYINLMEDDEENGREAFEEFNWVQLAHNCYYQASAAMFRCLCHWHKVESDHTLVDIPRYMRHHADAKQIWTHIFGKDGGQSRDVLDSLLGDKWELMSIGQALLKTYFPPSMMEYLTTFGPVLASNVILPSNFETDNAVPMRGSSAIFPTGKGTERHAMVVLGAGKNGDNSWYLLQNWYPKKQYLVVDFDWLKKSSAVFYTLTVKKGSFQPTDLDQHVFHKEELFSYSECSPSVDRCEGRDRFLSSQVERSS